MFSSHATCDLHEILQWIPDPKINLYIVTSFFEIYKIDTMSKYSKMGLVFLAGAAAGAVAGLLLAPDKGTETRKKIAGKAKDLKETVTEKMKEGLQMANEMKEKFTKEAEEILS